MKAKHPHLVIVIIAEVIVFATILFFLNFDYVHASETENNDTVATYEEWKKWLESHRREGGTVVLTDDITVPEDENYLYDNGKYRKNITVKTAGHTIYVKGQMELWPFLSLEGTGGSEGIFHVCPGGSLTLISVSILAGSDKDTAVVQEEGSFFVYGEETGMGLPEFFCQGRMILADKPVVSAASAENYQDMPVIVIPEEENFSVSCLPAEDDVTINQSGKTDSTAIPVIWQDTDFPKERVRTVITGTYPDDYVVFRDQNPRCLVVYGSSTNPYFLLAFAETYQNSGLILHMDAFVPQEGTVTLQGSDDKRTWSDLESQEVSEGEQISWYPAYNLLEEESYTYYKMSQRLPDGTTVDSDILELTEEYTMEGTGIEGGRGGETRPTEGEDALPPLTQVPGGTGGMGNVSASSASDGDNTSDSDAASTGTGSSSVSSGKKEENKEENKEAGLKTPDREENPEEDTNYPSESLQIGVGIVLSVCVVGGILLVFLFRRKRR